MARQSHKFTTSIGKTPLNHTFPSTILAIDSTSGACSVAIWKNEATEAYCEELTSTQQSKQLILMIEEVLNKSNTQYNGISAIACTIGPGSFTGIRIGLATARGIGFASNIPVLGFSALEVLAFGEVLQHNNNTPVLATMNAGKGEIIYQYFNHELEATCPPTLAKAAETEITILPRADILAQLAIAHQDKAVAPLPFYVRPPDAKIEFSNKHNYSLSKK